MPSLDSLIARTQAAIDAETDPRKLRPLQANLAAFLATKAEMDGDDDEDDKGDEESKAAKHRAKAAKEAKASEAAKHRAKAAEYKAKAAESEEAAKKCEEDEEESESEEAAALAAGASAAVTASSDALLTKLANRVAEMERAQVASTKDGLVKGARKLGAITGAEARWLEGQPLATVQSFLEVRSKAGLVATSEEQLVKPKDAKPGTEESLPTETLEMIESAVNAYTLGDRKAYREELVKAHLSAHSKQVKAAMNGAPGRY